ncbi:flagellar hook-length control protein [Mycobacteroides abscessus subsp. abscessus]|uniref:hypothetical protein n=1 Tax=Mycobacteroides abscessus TaxID=36809 RepID=UPI000929AEC4|nr:hypothetical protein [Mycobacteroides abscessus]SIL58144.1 flagellar hook-length control protein [Mycobacteroides abscessus subsp. abscessus]SLC82085.1 flagellar hook-length control protein [Mycobacteroides abscessus subsp. abscessus]
MSATTTADLIRAATSVARDVSDGKLDPATLEQQMVEELQALVAVVVGAGDPLWPIQIDVARGVLAAGGIPTDEMAEWLAVQRRLENPDSEPLSAAVPLDGSTTPPKAISSGSGELSPENDAADDDFADVPREVLAEAERAALDIINAWRDSQR